TASDCVDRLADIALRASRYQANAEICLSPKFLDVTRPGRWIVWDSDQFGERTFQIVSKRLGGITEGKSVRNIYLTLQEVGDGGFDATEYVTTPPTIILPGAGDYANEATEFDAQAIGLESPGGEIIPAFRFTWEAFEDTTVSEVEIEYR